MSIRSSLQSIYNRVIDRLFGATIAERVRETVRVDDSSGSWRSASESPNTVPWSTRWTDLDRLATATRLNPIASRLVSMTTDFIIGGGIKIRTDSKWVRTFWDDPMNDMDSRVYRWCDELTRSGELFIVLSQNTNDTRLQYVREIPARVIDKVETLPNDIEQEESYHQMTTDLEGKTWPSYSNSPDAPAVMLHFAINKPVGDSRGQSDLLSILPWLERYELWLEDRVRINRYKGAYLWHVRIETPSPGELDAKRAQYSKSPASGTIIVSDAREHWLAVQPDIKADDVAADGKAIRLLIAAGAGIPLHFLAEGESATRATAREMGGPTYRHYAHRQFTFEHMIQTLIRIAARRAGQGDVEIDVEFDPIMSTDPAMAAAQIAAQPGPDAPAKPNTQTDTEEPATLSRPTPGPMTTMKHWRTVRDDNVCEQCMANERAGWIEAMEPYPSGHDEPPAHDKCRCHEETKTYAEITEAYDQSGALIGGKVIQ
jgi:hypothetical protein